MSDDRNHCLGNSECNDYGHPAGLIFSWDSPRDLMYPDNCSDPLANHPHCSLVS